MNSDDKAVIKRAEKLAEHLLSRYAAYHDRKEAMAHAILLLEVALFGAVMTAQTWPPTWISDGPILLRVVALIVLMFLCLLAHILIRWQLRHRRWAAKQYAGVLRMVSKWVYSPPNPEDLKVVESPESKTGKWEVLWDYVFYCPSARIKTDINNEYPKAIADALREQNEEGTGAGHSEKIMFVASIVMLGMVLIRSFPLISCCRWLAFCGRLF